MNAKMLRAFLYPGVRSLLAAIVLLYSLPLWSAEELCHYRFTLPEGVHTVSRRPSQIIVEKGHKSARRSRDVLKTQWLFSCVENIRRTSQVSEITNGAQSSKQRVHFYERVRLDQGIEAVLSSRTRIYKGQRIHSIHAYFATRNFEYHFYALPRIGKGQTRIYKTVDEHQWVQKMKALLQKGRFTNVVEKTITEAQFQRRLYVLLGLSFLLVFVIGFMALRRFFRQKPQKPN